jgi:hypothetical protein
MQEFMSGSEELPPAGLPASRPNVIVSSDPDASKGDHPSAASTTKNSASSDGVGVGGERSLVPAVRSIPSLIPPSGNASPAMACIGSHTSFEIVQDGDGQTPKKRDMAKCQITIKIAKQPTGDQPLVYTTMVSQRVYIVVGEKTSLPVVDEFLFTMKENECRRVRGPRASLCCATSLLYTVDNTDLAIVELTLLRILSASELEEKRKAVEAAVNMMQKKTHEQFARHYKAKMEGRSRKK